MYKRQVYDLLIEDNFDTKKAVMHTGIENLDIIPASVDLAGAEIEMVEIEGREARLRKSIQKVKDDYDYIFIDCPPSLGLLTINSLTAVESVLIPIPVSYTHLILPAPPTLFRLCKSMGCSKVVT